MIIIDIPFTKEVDDETCAILKVANKLPPVAAVVAEIEKIFLVMPKVREQIKRKLQSVDGHTHDCQS